MNIKDILKDSGMMGTVPLNPETPYFDDECVIDSWSKGSGGYRGSIAVHKDDVLKVIFTLNDSSTHTNYTIRKHTV